MTPVRTFLPAVRVAALAACCAAAWPVAPASASPVQSFERVVPLEGAERLDVEARAGRVSLRGGDEREVRIEVSVDCPVSFFEESCRRHARRLEIEAERRADRLDVELRGMHLLASPGMEVEMRLTVPRELAARLHLSFGEVAVSGLDGEVEVELGIGEVDVRDAGGAVRVEAGIGEVSVEAEPDRVGRVRIELGIGESRLVRPEGIDSKASVLGSESEWEVGAAPGEVRVRLGIGDVEVLLR